MVKRRLVFQMAGYDPVDTARHHRRFLRGLPIFARTWNVTVAASGVSKPSEDEPARWTVMTRGENWRVDTTYEPLYWGDIVAVDFARSMPQRLGLFMMALFDFFRTATAFRYFRARWKYGFFFLYPALYLLAFAVVGVAAGYGLGTVLGLQGLALAASTAVVSVPVFAGLLQWLGRRWRIVQALDDWIFAWDYLHGRRFDVEARLNRFAQRIAAVAREGNYDEIAVIGHSLGATLAVNVVARALDRDPALGRRGTPVVLLTVGSTIPKFTLHPDAVRIRLDVARVANSGVQWAEFHARADPISFYRFDPVSGRKMDDRYDSQPIIRMVRIRAMVEKATYRRIQFKFMRVHHQFVMANELRTNYDFYMMGCGPVPILRAAMALNGHEDFLAADGSLIETPKVAPDRIAAAG